jgi:site-specific recombinase XerD
MTGRDEDIIIFNNRSKEIVKKSPKFMEEFYYSMTGLQSSSRYLYIKLVKNYLDYFSSKLNIETKDISRNTLNKIKQIDIEQYIDYLENNNMEKEKKGQNNIITRIAAIKRFYCFLNDHNYITNNPALKVKYKKKSSEKNPVFLDKKEIKQLFQNVEDGLGVKEKNYKMKMRDKLLFLIPCVTGMRVTPLREININDINFDYKTITVVEKENFVRTFQLDDGTFKDLMQWIEERKEILNGQECEALFITKWEGTYQRISSAALHKIYKKYTANLNKNIPPHGMRRTFANMAYEFTGHDIYAVSAMLGHAQIDTTRKYVAADTSKKREISNKIFSTII